MLPFDLFLLQFRNPFQASIDFLNLYQRVIEPLPQFSASHGCHRLIQDPEKRPLFPLVKEGLSEFQISLGYFIDDQEILNPIAVDGPDMGNRFLLILFRIMKNHGYGLGCQRDFLEAGRSFDLIQKGEGIRVRVSQKVDETILKRFLEFFKTRMLLKPFERKELLGFVPKSLIEKNLKSRNLGGLQFPRRNVQKGQTEYFQAINAGDAMFALAILAILRLTETASPEITINSSHVLLKTCLELTKGQFLDMGYEDRTDLTIDDYWPMVRGKTAALLAACTELGAIVADVDAPIRKAFHRFGQSLGLAFQAHDDYLGIWGDAALTGKSSESDLITGKKSLPVLYGLPQRGQFAKRWFEGPIKPDEVPALATQLELEGARHYTQESTERLTRQALDALAETGVENSGRKALAELAHLLLAPGLIPCDVIQMTIFGSVKAHKNLVP